MSEITFDGEITDHEPAPIALTVSDCVQVLVLVADALLELAGNDVALARGQVLKIIELLDPTALLPTPELAPEPTDAPVVEVPEVEAETETLPAEELAPEVEPDPEPDPAE
jgi:hypothetical protein